MVIADGISGWSLQALAKAPGLYGASLGDEIQTFRINILRGALAKQIPWAKLDGVFKATLEKYCGKSLGAPTHYGDYLPMIHSLELGDLRAVCAHCLKRLCLQ